VVAPGDSPKNRFANAEFWHVRYTVLEHLEIAPKCWAESVRMEVIAQISAVWNGCAWIPQLQNKAELPDWLADYFSALPSEDRVYYRLDEA